MSLMASFCAVLFPLDVLDEICDFIESVSEGLLPTLVLNTMSSFQFSWCLVLGYLF